MYLVCLNDFFCHFMKKEIMKNLLWLICVLTLSYSCKQTQLTSNYNKRSNKIYTKAPSRLNDIDFVSKEKKASKLSRSIIITKAVKKQLYSNGSNIRDDLFANVSNTKSKLIKNEKRIHQNLIKIDSVLKSQVSNLENEGEVLDLSKKAKKYNFISLINLLLTTVFSIIAFVNNVVSFGILSAIFGINTFIFSIMSFYFFLKAIKKIKKSGKKFKDADVTIKKNLRLALFSVFLCLIPMIIVLIGIIDIMINGIYISI